MCCGRGTRVGARRPSGKVVAGYRVDYSVDSGKASERFQSMPEARAALRESAVGGTITTEYR